MLERQKQLEELKNKKETEAEESEGEEEGELGQMAVGYYSIIDSAYRANKGIKIKEYKKDMADLYEKLSIVASTNKDS